MSQPTIALRSWEAALTAAGLLAQRSGMSSDASPATEEAAAVAARPAPPPAYPAARNVAPKIADHFARHQAAYRATAGVPVPDVDAAAIETMIDAAFWASLRREEGRSPTISLAFVPPSLAGMPLVFDHHLPLYPAGLAKLAPAVEQPGIHLGIWRDNGHYRVWGTTRTLPPHCFVIEVVASGLLVIKHRGEPFGKFINVAVLEGDQVKFVDETQALVPDCPGVLKSLLGVEPPNGRGEALNVLVQVAVAMRRHGRGGALLVVSRGSDWSESIVTPVLYALSPPFSELGDVLRQSGVDAADRDWLDQLRNAVNVLAGLTAVDGATIISDQFDVLGFGAKITRRRGHGTPDRVIVTEPIEGAAMTTVSPSQLGGTRHYSAAQFVHDQHDAIALVASQDGRFTIFKWSDTEEMVHAHRVESLLL